jgi:hypothetical protein
MDKIYCSTHRLWHKDLRCPLCEQERVKKMVARFKCEEEKQENTREATIEDVQKLINKFNR